MGVIAKGARHSRRRFLNAVQPFSLFQAQLDVGRGELARLKSVEILQPYSRIMASLDRIRLASAAMTLLRSALPQHAAEPRLFQNTLELLQLLNDEAPPRIEHLLCFQVHALAVLGFKPRFDQCGSCGRQPRPSQLSYFDPTLGALKCGQCGQAGYALSPAARFLLLSNWSECYNSDTDPLPDQECVQADKAIGAFISEHIGGTSR